MLCVLPCIARGQTPVSTTLQELMEVQRAVQSALPQAQRALVALEHADGAASGVIVQPDGLILTAAHVACELGKDEKPGRRLKVTLADGTKTMATALGMDVSTDAAMLQIDGKRTDWPYVALQRSSNSVKEGDWCFALGHPGGYDRSRGSVVRMGKVIKVAPNNLQTDCVLMGGDSGGALFDVNGELIGIHSQIWEGRDQNVHVALAPFLRSWDAMRESQVVRVWEQGSGGWLGIATRVSPEGRIEVEDVAAGSPALRAGIRAGDTLISIDNRPVSSKSQFSTAVQSRAEGDSVVLVIRNRAGNRIVTVKLGKRPKP